MADPVSARQKRRIEQQLKDLGVSLEQVITRTMTLNFSNRLARSVIKDIKQRVSRGQNPIKGWPRRYPAYKGVDRVRDFDAARRSISRQARARGESPRNVREFQSARKSAKSLRKKTYPFSVQNDFPDKRQRPVNLKLSGDMLDDMDFTVEKLRGGVEIELDYRTDLSRDKEQGHREGVNDQPKRPILALSEKNEQYIAPIQRNARKLVQTRVDKVIKEFNKRARRVR